MKKYVFPVAIMLLVALGYSMPALAQTGLAAPPSFGLTDLSGGTGLTGLITRIVNIILGISAAVAILFIIIGGFQYILSGANEGLAKRGKTTLTNAVIGLIIIILSYTVIRVVSRVFTTGTVT